MTIIVQNCTNSSNEQLINYGLIVRMLQFHLKMDIEANRVRPSRGMIPTWGMDRTGTQQGHNFTQKNKVYNMIQQHFHWNLT